MHPPTEPGDGELHVPREFRRGLYVRQGADRSRVREAALTDSAVWLITHMCNVLGLDDLGDTEVLDVGCGTKFTQALLNRSLPIKRYVGLDVDSEMIEFLRDSVNDSRFEYFHVNAHNARYNPRGEPLSEETELPLQARTFDVICLFSVFTHLEPRDYRTMLRLLRRHIEPDGRLFYTLYIDELTEHGHGLMDAVARKVGASRVGTIDTFEELDVAGSGFPGLAEKYAQQPLMFAVYSERYARELIGGTGWEVLTLLPPDEHIQHHFVCAPR